MATPEPTDESYEQESADFLVLTNQLVHDGASKLYRMEKLPGKPPRYIQVATLDQLTSPAIRFRNMWKNRQYLQTKLNEVAGNVAALQEHNEQKAARAAKLTRWDYIAMAIFGADKWVKRLEARDIKANQSTKWRAY